MNQELWYQSLAENIVRGIAILPEMYTQNLIWRPCTCLLSAPQVSIYMIFYMGKYSVQWAGQILEQDGQAFHSWYVSPALVLFTQPEELLCLPNQPPEELARSWRETWIHSHQSLCCASSKKFNGTTTIGQWFVISVSQVDTLIFHHFMNPIDPPSRSGWPNKSHFFTVSQSV